MTTTYERERVAAIAAVRHAAQICRSVQSKIAGDAMHKEDRSPVTIADFASQAVICRALESAFPDDPVIGEEDADALRSAENSSYLERIAAELSAAGVPSHAGEICDWIDRGGAGDYSERFWTLDPIDGTKGFLRGEQFAVALALIVNGQIELGLLGCPNLSPPGFACDVPGSLFVAVRGKGCVCLPLADGAGESVSVRVSATSDGRQTKLCESVESGHSAHDRSKAVIEALGIQGEPVRMDSQAKYAAVAAGMAEIYLRLPTRRDYREKIWDHAAGVLVVEEAGGQVTDIQGRKLEFHHGRELIANQGLVVTNGLWHARLLQTLREQGIAAG